MSIQLLARAAREIDRQSSLDRKVELLEQEGLTELDPIGDIEALSVVKNVAELGLECPIFHRNERLLLGIVRIVGFLVGVFFDRPSLL